jgi:hypothetical protein
MNPSVMNFMNHYPIFSGLTFIYFGYHGGFLLYNNFFGNDVPAQSLPSLAGNDVQRRDFSNMTRMLDGSYAPTPKRIVPLMQL